MGNQPRVRFAPSPTGYLHVGGLRTALYNYLYAKQHGGAFVLRIEDTDQSRKVEGAVENLTATLQWAGVQYDEGPDRPGAFGPYIQSERLALYRSHARQLLESGHAYRCFCTPERLDEARKKRAEQKLSFAYDRHCRSIPPEEAARRAASGELHVIRMKVPLEGALTFRDLIRGEVTIGYDVLDDQVIMKSDGFPTYHLAVVVDDHHMAITHVIRGEEWLPSAPKHVLLYQYFGWDLPVFAHLPLLLNPDKSKLSKRQGDVAVEDYRAKGYLKEAIVNFVAFLGWNPGDERELFSIEQLVGEFRLERVQKGGAVFNVEKLNWLNQQHMKLKTNEELACLIRPMLEARNVTIPTDAYLASVAGLLKERVVLLPDVVDASEYFFREPSAYDPAGVTKSWSVETPPRMILLADRLEHLPTFDHTAIEAAIRALADEQQVKVSVFIHPTRLAVTGRTAGPGLFELMEVIGRDHVVARLRNAAARIMPVS
jgi:glutamyl-tRNA synthetase